VNIAIIIKFLFLVIILVLFWCSSDIFLDISLLLCHFLLDILCSCIIYCIRNIAIVGIIDCVLSLMVNMNQTWTIIKHGQSYVDRLMTRKEQRSPSDYQIMNKISQVDQCREAQER
jgi:hypothetical protein